MRTARLDERGLVAVDVADTSAGVDPLVAGGMFEPSVTDTAGTLGIGLTIDKTIVEGFGGQISLNTPMTTGTELRIQLPACGATHR